MLVVIFFIIIVIQLIINVLLFKKFKDLDRLRKSQLKDMNPLKEPLVEKEIRAENQCEINI